MNRFEIVIVSYVDCVKGEKTNRRSSAFAVTEFQVSRPFAAVLLIQLHSDSDEVKVQRMPQTNKGTQTSNDPLFSFDLILISITRPPRGLQNSDNASKLLLFQKKSRMIEQVLLSFHS